MINQKGNAGNAGIAIVLIIGLFMVMVVVIIAAVSSKDKPVGTVETQEEWCEVGQVMSDGSIIYHGDPGTTELIAMATSEGPKLMGKCK